MLVPKIQVPKAEGGSEETYGEELIENKDPNAVPYPYHICIDINEPIGPTRHATVAGILDELYPAANPGSMSS